jgi:UDP-N-acetylglucosamine 2-epimerase
VRIAVVVGARPQFVKAAPVLKTLIARGHDAVQVHTGQHYDYEMSEVFFRDLGIPEPDHNLEVGSAPHGRQTGEMLIALEPILEAAAPAWTLVFGDTNSTLAGALAACKLQLRIAHIEAGLRSFNRAMPEEHNRRLTDHCSDLLFCPSQTAVDNLRDEGITAGVHLVGDTMLDAILLCRDIARARSTILHDLAVCAGDYLLATIHRPYNTDDPARLAVLLDALAETGATVVVPVHPRTRQAIEAWPGLATGNLRLIDPVGYLDMLALLQNARAVMTDSGGLQKEAVFLGTRCVTLRPETEWVETIETGWNRLGGDSVKSILTALDEVLGNEPTEKPSYGDGTAAARIVDILTGELPQHVV